ncbi:hypothetical protein [Polaribacter butkevichii]|uniref:Uncharacterized protein n=1 Tax=Polaribacter butkevichii TaxID=218490 RepID=A0A2P6CAM2_9FLAO|nr:hypothetical protein [Polaribacter butkevichii]PQJ71940.1 hypothetical protein BTO14_01135 [Polaribacter butkevichii]
MKVKMLPNWCKKLGLAVFFIGFIISGFKGFMDGLTASTSNTSTFDFFENLCSKSVLHLFEVLAIIGMVIYMFSKEKVEDDYINILRLESFQLTSLIGLLITITSYIAYGNLNLNLDYFINLYLMFYLIIFAIKKRNY